MLTRGHHTILLLLTSLPAPRDAREGNTQTWAAGREQEPLTCTPPFPAGVRCEGKVRAGKKGQDSPAWTWDIPAAATGEGQPAEGQGAGTGATGLLCANGTHTIFFTI